MAATPITSTEEFTSSISAQKLFQAFVFDAPTLFPKAVPQAIKSIQIVQGTGGPGTIHQVNFVEGTGYKYAKNRIDLIDKETLTYKYTVIEGDVLLGKLESISTEVKLKSTADGKCKGTNISKYYPKAGIEIKEEDLKEGKEKAKGVLDAVEAYLLANP